MGRLAQKKSIAPPGFNYDNFVQQESTRNKRASDARGRADDAKGKAADARQRWLAIQGEADKVLGKKNEFPDPMGNKAPGNDPSAGAGGMTIGGSGDGQAPPPADDPAQPQPQPQPEGGQ
jgi:hypothetical protein